MREIPFVGVFLADGLFRPECFFQNHPNGLGIEIPDDGHGAVFGGKDISVPVIARFAVDRFKRVDDFLSCKRVSRIPVRIQAEVAHQSIASERHRIVAFSSKSGRVLPGILLDFFFRERTGCK